MNDQSGLFPRRDFFFPISKRVQFRRRCQCCSFNPSLGTTPSQNERQGVERHPLQNAAQLEYRSDNVPRGRAGLVGAGSAQHDIHAAIKEHLQHPSVRQHASVCRLGRDRAHHGVRHPHNHHLERDAQAIHHDGAQDGCHLRQTRLAAAIQAHVRDGAGKHHQHTRHVHSPIQCVRDQRHHHQAQPTW